MPSLPDESRRSGRARDLQPVAATVEPIARLAAALAGTPIATVSLVDEARERVLAAWSHGGALPLKEVPVAVSFAARVVDADSPRSDAQVLDQPDLADAADLLGVRAWLGVPVRLDGEPVGVIAVADHSPRDWPAATRATLSDLAELTGRLLAASEVRREPPRERAVPVSADSLDAATGALGRRAFQTLAHERMSASRRERVGLMLILVRLDGVERARERVGGGAADAAVAEVVRMLRSGLGERDLFGRVAADTFVILGTDGGHVDAARRLGRIQLGFAELDEERFRPLGMTLRCGLAPWDPAGGIGLDQLYLRADASARDRARMAAAPA